MAGKQRRDKRKSRRGVGDYWDEVKCKVSIAITPTAILSLDETADNLELSRSELVERFARAIALKKLDIEKLLDFVEFNDQNR